MNINKCIYNIYKYIYIYIYINIYIYIFKFNLVLIKKVANKIAIIR